MRLFAPSALLALLGAMLGSVLTFPVHSSSTPFDAQSAPAGARMLSSVNEPVNERVHLWRGTKISYAFDVRVPEITRVLFRTGAMTWNNHTSWQLTETSQVRAADVLIRPHATRCAADRGAPASGRQSKVFLSTQCTLRSMVHEIGHIIGMVHEHQRPDRSSRIVLRPDTLAYIKQHYPDAVYQNVIQNLRPLQSNPGQPYAFDEGSIMMYGSFPQREPLKSDLRNRNLPLFTRLDGSLIEAGPARLSNKDIAYAEVLANLATTVYLAAPKY